MIMFREMRRKRQKLSDESNMQILEKMTNGVLALHGDDDYPYAVPVSYALHDGKIYIHSAVEGHKIDAIKRSDKASFCVIEQDKIVPEKFTTYYRSVIIFGRIRIINDKEKIYDILKCIAEKYSPEEKAAMPHEIEKSLNHVCIIELTPEHITGKESIELV